MRALVCAAVAAWVGAAAGTEMVAGGAVHTMKLASFRDDGEMALNGAAVGQIRAAGTVSLLGVFGGPDAAQLLARLSAPQPPTRARAPALWLHWRPTLGGGTALLSCVGCMTSRALTAQQRASLFHVVLRACGHFVLVAPPSALSADSFDLLLRRSSEIDVRDAGPQGRDWPPVTWVAGHDNAPALLQEIGAALDHSGRSVPQVSVLRLDEAARLTADPVAGTAAAAAITAAAAAAAGAAAMPATQRSTVLPAVAEHARSAAVSWFEGQLAAAVAGAGAVEGAAAEGSAAAGTAAVAAQQHFTSAVAALQADSASFWAAALGGAVDSDAGRAAIRGFEAEAAALLQRAEAEHSARQIGAVQAVRAEAARLLEEAVDELSPPCDPAVVAAAAAEQEAAVRAKMASLRELWPGAAAAVAAAEEELLSLLDAARRRRLAADAAIVAAAAAAQVEPCVRLCTAACAEPPAGVPPASLRRACDAAREAAVEAYADAVAAELPLAHRRCRGSGWHERLGPFRDGQEAVGRRCAAAAGQVLRGNDRAVAEACAANATALAGAVEERMAAALQRCSLFADGPRAPADVGAECGQQRAQALEWLRQEWGGHSGDSVTACVDAADNQLRRVCELLPDRCEQHMWAEPRVVQWLEAAAAEVESSLVQCWRCKLHSIAAASFVDAALARADPPAPTAAGRRLCIDHARQHLMQLPSVRDAAVLEPALCATLVAAAVAAVARFALR